MTAGRGGPENKGSMSGWRKGTYPIHYFEEIWLSLSKGMEAFLDKRQTDFKYLSRRYFIIETNYKETQRRSNGSAAAHVAIIATNLE